MRDTLKTLKSAMDDLKKMRPNDEKQDSYLDFSLKEILDCYGYALCTDCDEIGPTICYHDEAEMCLRCHDRACRLMDNDDWEYKHRHD